MLTNRIKELVAGAEQRGWLLEPEGNELMMRAGLPVPRFSLAGSEEEAVRSARRIGYPVAAKVVSPLVLHKSDKGGVVPGVPGDNEVREAWRRLSAIEGFEGMLVEEMVKGAEMIVGAKIDFQFGPVILLGMGGTAVEVFPDVAIRMAPLADKDPELMFGSLRGRKLLSGYRGRPAVNVAKLSQFLLGFSRLVMDLHPYLGSIDLNPVMCSPEACTIADVRIMVKAPVAAAAASQGG